MGLLFYFPKQCQFLRLNLGFWFLNMALLLAIFSCLQFHTFSLSIFFVTDFTNGPLKYVDFFVKGGYPIIFASNVFHNSYLIQKCIQNQQQIFWPRCSSERSYNPLWWICCCCCDFSPKLALNSWELEIYIRTSKEAYGKHRGHSSLCHWGFLEASLRPFRGHLEADFSPKLAINPWKPNVYIRTIKDIYGTNRGF